MKKFMGVYISERSDKNQMDFFSRPRPAHRPRLLQKTIWLSHQSFYSTKLFQKIFFIIITGLFITHGNAEEKSSDFKKNAALFQRKCSQCHTVGKGDRVGPDLKGVLERRDREWLIGFIMHPSQYLDTDPVAQKMLEKYDGVRMDNLNLTRSQVEGLLEYLKALETVSTQPKEERPLEKEPLREKLHTPIEKKYISSIGLVVLIFSVLLMFILWSRGKPWGVTILFVISVAAAYWTFGGHTQHLILGNREGYAPEQPIDFSHAKHAGELKISCFYCHHGAEKSPVAGVPSVNICMNCHKVVRKTKEQKKPSLEIQKIIDIWESRKGENPKSIEWKRVHNLPDFVRFSHQEHVRNNIQCQECHGPVEKMKRMRQIKDWSMSACIKCHRHEPGDAPTHWQRSSGSLDCVACHI